MSKIVDWRRWQGWRGHVTFWKGWAAWQIYRIWPVRWTPSWSYAWLLPSVGDWAYFADAIAAMKKRTSGGNTDAGAD